MKINGGFAAVAAALAVQVVAISWLVWRYERIVLNGTEVRIKCQAYDPYDPLRGRYLGMTVSEECTNILFRVEERDEYAHHKDIFAKLAEIPGRNGIYRVEAVAKEPDGNGLWAKCESASFGYLLEWNAQKKNESNEEFWKRRNKSGRKAVVSFPDRLFVNEKIAPVAEKLLRKRTASAVAVYRVLDGEIVLTDIEINGQSILSAVKEGHDD